MASFIMKENRLSNTDLGETDALAWPGKRGPAMTAGCHPVLGFRHDTTDKQKKAFRLVFTATTFYGFCE